MFVDPLTINGTYSMDAVMEQFHLRVYKLLMTVIPLFGLFCCFLYALLLLFSTRMEFAYKLLALTHVCSQIVFSLNLLLWQPAVWSQFLVFYPVGFASPMSANMSWLCFGVCWFSVIVSMDCLFLSVIKRHFELTAMMDKERNVKMYYVLAVLTAPVFLSLPAALLTCTRIDPTQLGAKLNASLTDGKDFLEYQPSLASYYFGQNVIFVCTATVVVFASTRGATMFWIFFRDLYFFYRKVRISQSTATQRAYGVMVLRVSLQILIIFPLAGPVSWGVVTFYLYPESEHAGPVLQYCLAVLSAYPIVNFVIVISMVEKYRTTLMALVRRLLGLRGSLVYATE